MMRDALSVLLTRFFSATSLMEAFSRFQVREVPVEMPTAEHNQGKASNCKERKGKPRNYTTPRQSQNSPKNPRQQHLAIMQIKVIRLQYSKDTKAVRD